MEQERVQNVAPDAVPIPAILSLSYPVRWKSLEDGRPVSPFEVKAEEVAYVPVVFPLEQGRAIYAAETKEAKFTLPSVLAFVVIGAKGRRVGRQFHGPTMRLSGKGSSVLIWRDPPKQMKLL